MLVRFISGYRNHFFRSLISPRITNPHPFFGHFYASSSSSSEKFEFEDNKDDNEGSISVNEGSRIIQQLLAEVEQDRKRERDARIRAGLGTEDLDAEENEDYIGVGPIIEKLEKEDLKKVSEADLYRYEEPTDSEDESEKEEEETMIRETKTVKKKIQRLKELMDAFTSAETMDEAYMLMKKIDNFEEKHFKLRLEYRVVGDLFNKLKVAEGKEKFLLQVKLNRAMRLIEWREKFDPNNPANYLLPELEDGSPNPNLLDEEEQEEDEEEKGIAKKEESEDDATESEGDDTDSEEFDDIVERDEELLGKLHSIDKKIEEKLAALEYTFGKKGRNLEEDIKVLADERNTLTQERKKPVVRKGFDTRLIDLNRTCKVTKGGQVIKYTAIVVCGNYNGTIGYAKAKSPTVPMAVQKARDKSFQNLHYVERHEEHTIAHAVYTNYKKTKVYLWPARTKKGMSAGKTVMAILHLAGFKNIKSKVIGSRNPHNTVKAVFKALNAIETPKDVQEKFGRVVVEKHLL